MPVQACKDVFSQRFVVPQTRREEVITYRQRMNALRDKLCTVPEFLKSQVAYRWDYWATQNASARLTSQITVNVIVLGSCIES